LWYPQSTNQQDGLVIIASYTGFAPDDFPDAITNVTVTNITNSTSFSVSRIVGKPETGDRDTFRFWTKQAKLKVAVVLASGITCLDSQPEVLDALGNVVYDANTHASLLFLQCTPQPQGDHQIRRVCRMLCALAGL
jgi:hypothetical protein